MKDYITIGGRKVRVECNWNAIVACLESEGRDSMEGLTGFGKLRPSDIAPLMAASINEGERLDGRESTLSPADVGALAGYEEITDFVRVYASQRAPKTPEEGAVKKKAGGL